MNKKSFIAFFVVASFLLMSLQTANTKAAIEPIAHLTFKTNGGGARPDYGLYIAQYLAEIGIDVDVKVEEWIIFVGTLTVTYDFDMGIVALTGGAGDPDPSGVYKEAASLNMFGINKDMPYGNDSENLMIEGVTIVEDLEARQQLYYEWQQLLMDKIVPMLPLYSPRAYTATWATLTGYDQRWGYVECLPYMEWTDFHDGQKSLTEFIDSDANWKELNPLLQDDASSSTISSLVMEPILQMNPDYHALTTGLVDSWEQINETYYTFHMREGVYWNPSYDTTARDGSTPLADETPVAGLKGLASDGANQEVTAKDAVFTYLAWANKITSEDDFLYDWIRAIWVDSLDEYTFHIVIDGNADTPVQDNYAPFWVRLTSRILPEFFLNSTDPGVTTTGGGVDMTGIFPGILLDPSWILYSTSAFGCGKYMLDYSVQNSVTVLQKSPYWFGIGAIDGTDQDLDIDTFIMRVIPDQTSALAEFKAGKLSIMSLALFPAERKHMQQDARFEVQTQLVGQFTFLFYNLRRPFVGGDANDIMLDAPGKEDYTKGAAVRKALNYAIDRDEMNQVLHDGDYLLSDSPIYPVQAYWYYHDIVKYRYDLDASFEWLHAAGIITEIPTLTTETITTSDTVTTSETVVITTKTPMSLIAILGALGAVVFVALYKKRK